MENRKAYALIVVMMVATVAIIGTALITTGPPKLTMQTTTSMNDSGLLDLIKPAFDAKYGVNLRWIPVGTGQALTNAGLGDGDVVIVHSASLEKEFINHTSTKTSYSGHGIMRVSFAYNWFVIVGPTSDPAGITTNSTIASLGNLTFKAIYNAAQAHVPGVLFASRGDGSGTNTREISIWTQMRLWNTTSNWPKNVPQDASSWYKSLGDGMGETLIYANQQGAYTLTDYGTWLKLNSTGSVPNLKVVSGKQNADLKNTYSIIAVDPTRRPGMDLQTAMTRFELAKKLIYFMVHEGQNIMGNYTIGGQAVFYKYIKPDCGCGSSLCDIENGSWTTNFNNYHSPPGSDQNNLSLAPPADRNWDSLIELKNKINF